MNTREEKGERQREQQHQNYIAKKYKINKMIDFIDSRS